MGKGYIAALYMGQKYACALPLPIIPKPQLPQPCWYSSFPTHSTPAARAHTWSMQFPSTANCFAPLPIVLIWKSWGKARGRAKNEILDCILKTCVERRLGGETAEKRIYLAKPRCMVNPKVDHRLFFVFCFFFIHFCPHLITCL